MKQFIWMWGWSSGDICHPISPRLTWLIWVTRQYLLPSSPLYVPFLKDMRTTEADNLPQIKEELSSDKGVAVAELPCKHALKGFIWPNKMQKLSLKLRVWECCISRQMNREKEKEK